MTVYIVNATEWRKIILLESSEHIYPAGFSPKTEEKVQKWIIKDRDTEEKEKCFIWNIGTIGGKTDPGH